MLIFFWGSYVNNTETNEMYRHNTALYSSHTHNFRLLLCHFFFGNELLFTSVLFLILLWEMGVSQELFNELGAVQIVLGFPSVFCTVNMPQKQNKIRKREHTLILCTNKQRQHNMSKLILQHVTHSVKPFHFRKYSTLPLKILRRMIFSTTNSWTTVVSSVFLCLAVCFFLILPWMRSKWMTTSLHYCQCHSQAHVNKTYSVYLFIFC